LYNCLLFKKINITGIYKDRIIGLLFLGAFLCYGIGRNLFESQNNSEQLLGSLLIIINSIFVICIGILLRKTIKSYQPLVANIYLFTRIIEALALSSIIINLIPTVNISYYLGYHIAMLSLGIGSIPMCYILYKNNIVANWLAIWGITGYSLLSLGFLMELFGIKWSMYLLIIGGLWEITFAVRLIARIEKSSK